MSQSMPLSPSRFIARIMVLVQIGPDDWCMRPVTRVFPGDATLISVLEWAGTHEPGMLMNDVEITQPDDDDHA